MPSAPHATRHPRARQAVLPLACLALAATLGAGTVPPTLDRPVDYLDRLLGRPYAGGTPLRTTGPCVWTTHPDGWGFKNDVHYVQLDWIDAFHADLAWNGTPVEAGPAWAHISHLETWALPPGDLALNPTRVGLPVARGPQGDAWAAVDGDRRTLAPWSAAPDVSGEVWLEAELPADRELGSVLFVLVVDPARGFLLPAAYRLEVLEGGVWTVEPPPAPRTLAAGVNLHPFGPRVASRLRLVFTASAPVAVGEIEVYPPLTPPLDLVERKLVADDDTLIAVYTATNLGEQPATLALAASGPLLAGDPSGALVGSRVAHTVPLTLRLEQPGATLAGNSLAHDVVLPAGGSVSLTTALAFGRSAQAAKDLVSRALADPDPVATKVESTGRWFLDNVPQLDVPDPWFEKTWAHRFEIVRRTMTDPRFGKLQHPTFEEGRWAAPWFTRPITYGAPHQLKETRWLRDPAYSRGHALTFVENQRADGAFVSVPLEGQASEYTDWIAAALWEVYRVTGDTDLLARSLPAMRRNTDYVLTHDGDGDRLPLVTDHFMTGMEWQPAFFYFNDYYTDQSTPLERVDWAAALFAGARGAADAAAVLCDPASAQGEAALAEEVRDAVETKMWDEATAFYYSLREDDAKAMAREIVGFYPFAFGLADPAHDRALSALFDPADFRTPFPPASSSVTCPATSQDGWPIGPGGSQAMWNGPTWPHAISVVAEAAGRTLRRSGEQFFTRAQLFALLTSYTHANFWGIDDQRDFDEPFTGEYYHGNHGIWRTGERDYFHSTYADLLITLLIGLVPQDGPVLRVDPLLPPGVWDRFLLERAPYRGHQVTVVWDEPGGEDAYGDGHDGLEVYLDDALVAARPDLGPLEAPIPEWTIRGVKEFPAGGPRFTVDAPPPWSLFRATAPDLRGATGLAENPIASTSASDGAPPVAPAVFYRAGACGMGR